jgi:hypothetical protein
MLVPSSFPAYLNGGVGELAGVKAEKEMQANFKSGHMSTQFSLVIVRLGGDWKGD